MLMSDARSVADDILTACRVLTSHALVKAFGHVSGRLPEDPGRFLITPRKALALVDRQELVTVDLASGERAGGFPPLEVPLHTEIYRARPDVLAICRAHPPWCAVFGVLSQPIRPVHGFGTALGYEVPVFTQPWLITTEALGRAVAETLGQAEAVLLRGNGLAVVGRSVGEACVKAMFLEETAELYGRARALGEPVAFTPEEVEQRRETDRVHEPIRAWEFYRAMAGRPTREGRGGARTQRR